MLFVFISLGWCQSVQLYVGYIQNHYLIRYCHFLIAAAHYQIYATLNLEL